MRTRSATCARAVQFATNVATSAYGASSVAPIVVSTGASLTAPCHVALHMFARGERFWGGPGPTQSVMHPSGLQHCAVSRIIVN